MAVPVVRLADAPAYPRFDGSQLCAQTDPELFHPPDGSPGRRARQVCDKCPWVTECLEWAIWNDVQGIWGGRTAHWRLTERLRRGIPSPTRERESEVRTAILQASALVPSRQLGCDERTVIRHRKAARTAAEEDVA